MAIDLPARTTRQGIGGVGYEGDLRRTYLLHELHKGWGGVTLDVKLCRHDIL